MKLLTEGTNDMTRSAFVVTRLIRPELLFYEGFAGRPDQYDLIVQKDGKTIARTLPVLGRKPDGSPMTGGLSITPLPMPGSGWVSAAPSELPLWLENMDKQFWFAELPERSTLYIHDRLCSTKKTADHSPRFFRKCLRRSKKASTKLLCSIFV